MKLNSNPNENITANENCDDLLIKHSIIHNVYNLIQEYKLDAKKYNPVEETNKEMQFVKIVIEKVSKLKNKNPNESILILFDIDSTLAHYYFSRSEKKVTPLRAGALPLLKWLKNNSIEIGICSSRGLNDIKTQLTNSNSDYSIAKISKYLSTDDNNDYKYIYSTRTRRRSNVLGINEKMENYEKRNHVYQSVSSGLQNKLNEMQDIMQSNNHHQIILVDDGDSTQFDESMSILFPELINLGYQYSASSLQEARDNDKIVV